MRLKRGGKVTWEFSGQEPHSVTLANGPIGFASPNLDVESNGEPRTFERRFTRNGKYKIFCALHPVQMTERIVVEGKRKR